MTEKTGDTAADRLLEQSFAAARATPPELRPELMAAILEDARAARPASRRPARRPAPGGGWLAEFWRGLGGWPAGAALATAVVLGVTLGYLAPEPVAGLGTALLGGGAAEASELLYPGLDTMLTEG